MAQNREENQTLMAFIAKYGACTFGLGAKFKFLPVDIAFAFGGF